MKPDFSKLDGLMPAIVQDFETKEVLMLGFMNEEAWDKTMETKKATFYSRTRNKLWMKGEESGNIKEVKEILIDCDNDTVLLKVNQVGGAACHTGYRSCFYREALDNELTELKVTGEKIFNPEDKYGSGKK